MDMRRLEVFCKVVEFGNFTRAGEALSLSQPTVSEHIKILEETLNERLLDRLGREVLPTPSGRMFYQYALNILKLRDEAVQALDQFRGTLAGTLTIGASTIPGTYILPRFVGEFKSRYPDIRITLQVGDTAQIVDQVAENMVEFGVVGSKVQHRKLILEEVFSDELVLAVYVGHRWSSRKRITLEQLAEEPFIQRETGSGSRMVMNRILEENGFSPNRLRTVAEIGSTEAVREGIKSKIGVSILSRHAVATDAKHGLLRIVPIQGVRFDRRFYLVTRKNRQVAPLCQVFLSELRGASEETPPAPERNDVNG